MLHNFCIKKTPKLIGVVKLTNNKSTKNKVL